MSTKTSTKDTSAIVAEIMEKVSKFDHINQTSLSMTCSCNLAGENGSNCSYCTAIFQPPAPRPDCPVCFSSLEFGGMGGSLLSCCGAEMCVCCTLEVDCETDMKCPFCRALCQVSDKESERRLNQRMEVNDPRAFTIASAKARLAGDLMKALEMQLKAVELGCWNSFSGVGGLLFIMPMDLGIDNAEQILAAAKKFMETGAKRGCIECHNQLGELYQQTGSPSLAYKHFCFATLHGHTASSKKLLVGYAGGFINKEHYASCLRAHKAAYDETMSSKREFVMKRMHEINDEMDVNGDWIGLNWI